MRSQRDCTYSFSCEERAGVYRAVEFSSTVITCLFVC
jgi:hypothetical protein